MPVFYPQAMPGQAPLTPPYTDTYEQASCHQPHYHPDSYAPQQNMQPRLDSAVFTHRYPPPSLSQASFARQSFCNSQSLPPINTYYEPLGAPILPPLRMETASYGDRDFYHHQYPTNTSAQTEQTRQTSTKEEQPTGGVSAKLDYDMERMTDFVSEAAQGIIQPGTSVHPSFRKWVLQVLSATRLPSATILLSLHYLMVRIQKFPTSVDKSDNQLYRLLAVSMILGSKFLDDNTFINRSWSDVSGIKVTELNTLEIKWLALIGFDLHADPLDPNGVRLWLRAWQEYNASPMPQPKKTPVAELKSSPPRSAHFNQGTYAFRAAKSAHGSGTFTPMSTSSVNSASGTPYISADPWSRSDAFQPDFFTGLEYQNRYQAQAPARTSQYQQYSLPPLHSINSFYNAWNQPSWEYQHGYGCHCNGCARQPTSSYIMGSHITPQTVVG